MRSIHRLASDQVLRASRAFSAIVLTGPRRSGKTTLLRTLFPKAAYRLLEDPAILARVRSDPLGFLDELRPPAVLDEIQNAPELFAHVRARIDRTPTKRGQWFLTGSQEAPLMAGVTESMAGRAAVLQLLPLSRRETPSVTLLGGGFPEAALRPRTRSLWFPSYVQTYLERDVRAVTAVRDLAVFRRFLTLLATRNGQILNRTDLAAPLGVSVPTISQWVGVLETTGILLLVQPYFENLGKRLVKSPKPYFVDTGLLCHLLGIDSDPALRQSPFAGAVFEAFVASETIKCQVNAGRRREIYYFRDQQGLEVDFIIPDRRGGMLLVEAKATKTVRPAMADPALRLQRAFGSRRAEVFVVHGGADDMTALRPGAKATSLDGLIDRLES